MGVKYGKAKFERGIKIKLGDEEKKKGKSINSKGASVKYRDSGCEIGQQRHDTTRTMAIIPRVCLEQVKARGCTFKLYLPGYPSVEPGKGGARRGSAFPVEIYARGWLFHVGVND